jgi:DEAD/DEAH box helicase domain-containing protein
MRKITFDIETKNTFEDVGSNDSAALDMSVVCIHDSLDDQYKSFLEKDLKDLWPILEQADMLITFNGEHFDIPILNKYYSGDLSKIKHIDLLKEVRNSLGRRLKLDTIASATLGTNKSGSGLDAIEWWNNGEIEKIIKYCIDDVRITKELYDYAMENKHLKYKDNGVLKEIKLDTSNWEIPESGKMTFTLPF